MRRNRTKWTQVVLASCVALAVLGWPAQAHAHGVELGHEQVGAVLVEAMYDTGEPMADAQVLVYSPEDESDPWMTGSVDGEGNFLFEPTDTGTWVIEVRQAGHGDVLEIPVEETAASSEGAEEEEDQEGTDEPDEQGDQEPTPAPQDVDSEEKEDVGADADRTASGTAASPLQIIIMGALAVWGFVGTALYFVSRRRA